MHFLKFWEVWHKKKKNSFLFCNSQQHDKKLSQMFTTKNIMSQFYLLLICPNTHLLLLSVRYFHVVTSTKSTSTGQLVYFYVGLKLFDSHSNISVLSCWSIYLVEGTGASEENQRLLTNLFFQIMSAWVDVNDYHDFPREQKWVYKLHIIWLLCGY